MTDLEKARMFNRVLIYAATTSQFLTFLAVSYLYGTGISSIAACVIPLTTYLLSLFFFKIYETIKMKFKKGDAA